MIHPHEITIGSLLRTNKGEIIRVESISTKRKHRKVGYHTPDDPYRIKYVRLAQCEGIELTPGILMANGFDEINLSNLHRCYFQQKDNADETELYNVEVEYYSDTPDACFIGITYDSVGSVRLKCKYIHQLQFALICAGLPELTMNLKVE